MSIIFFDTWTKGIQNFLRIIPQLDMRGYNYKLVHLESWDYTETISEMINIKGIDCFDARYYRTINIFKILKQERPDIILILSLSFFLDKLIVTICKKLDIKIIYLSHGKYYRKEGVGKLSTQISIFNKIKRRATSKTLKILLNYFYVNLFLFFRPDRIFKAIIQFIIYSDRTMYTPFSKELEVEKAMVYYDSEKEMFENERNFPKGMVEAVGNPEMDFIVNNVVLERDSYLTSIGLGVNDNYLLYLEDGFVQENILLPSDWIEFINKVHNICIKNNLTLVIKLHPRTKLELYSTFFNDKSIHALMECDFKNLVYHSEKVISHSSSTVDYALYLNKHVLLPRWGKLTNLIKNYSKNNVTYVFSANELDKLISKELPAINNRKYVNENLGKMDGHVVDRIVETIDKIANKIKSDIN